MTIVGISTADGLVVLLVMTAVTVGGHRRQLRVHQGRNVSHEEYPYVMVLVAKAKILIPPQNISATFALRVCTCSLIKPAWVLIAAHCLNTYPLSMLKVIYGDLTIPLNATTHKTDIKKVFINKSYMANIAINLLKNDIALLLITPINQVKSLAKLSAVDYRALIGYPVTYLGGGTTFSLSNQVREDLKPVLETIEKDQTRPLQLGEAVVVKCDPKASIFNFLYPGICLVAKCSQPSQAMQGDSGGPLLFEGKIIGIASLSGPVSISTKTNLLRVDVGPGGAVYTAVSPYLDWINSVISQDH